MTGGDSSHSSEVLGGGEGGGGGKGGDGGRQMPGVLGLKTLQKRVCDGNGNGSNAGDASMDIWWMAPGPNRATPAHLLNPVNNPLSGGRDGPYAGPLASPKNQMRTASPHLSALQRFYSR